MPKEVIYTDQKNDFNIQVGWSHNAVQVGIETTSGEPLLDVLRDLEAGNLTPQFKSVWSNVDRQDINELIKFLRKARDAAFGRDE